MNKERYEYNLFILHDIGDIEFCTKIINYLKKKKLKICTQDTVLKKGQTESRTIETLLSKSQFITIVWSQNMYDNAGKKELLRIIIDIALNQIVDNKFLIIMIDDCNVLDVLKGVNVKKFDYSNTENFQTECEKLIKHINDYN